jgi:DNA polymerase
MLAGQQVQAFWGLSTVLPGVDFETASEAGFLFDVLTNKWVAPPGAAKGKKGLKVTGTRAYVEHPTFRLLSLAYDLKDGRGVRRWTPDQPPPRDLFDYVQRGGLLGGFNTEFEWTVWNLYCVPKLFWPPLPVQQLRCTQSKARAMALPGKLEKTGEVLRLPVQKDKDGTRLLNKFSIPRDPTKKDSRLWIHPSEDPADAERLYRYNEIDVDAEGAVALALPDLPPDELDVWLVDQIINQRGIAIDLKAIDDCIAVVEQAIRKYNGEFKALTGGLNTTQNQAIRKWMDARGVHTDSLDEEHREELLKTLPAGECRRVIELLDKIGSSSVKKLYSMRLQASIHGRLHGLYTYWGAATGRWTGNGPQPQNLPRPSKGFDNITAIETALKVIETRDLATVELCYGDALDAVASCLRSMFIAAPGHDFICSDFSAIEGVVMACISGEKWRIEVFQTHGMIYEMSASKLTGVPFEEFVEARVKTGGTVERDAQGHVLSIRGGKHHKHRQGIGKVSELSGQYAAWIGGWNNFGAQELLGSDDAVKAAILKYRSASPTFPELWGGQTRGRFSDARPELFGLEGCAVAAIMWPGKHFQTHGIKFLMEGDVLYMTLLSGRRIPYHRPRLATSRRNWAQPWEQEIFYECWDPSKKVWITDKLYGGVLTNNLVQGTARDIQAHGMVNLERAGYRIVMHTHDEIVAEVPTVRVPLKSLNGSSTSLPSWAVFPDGSPWPVK